MLKIFMFIFIIIGALLLLVVSNYNSLCDFNCKDSLKQGVLKHTELIALNGYTAEKHTIETEDGYKLIAYRIPHGKKVPAVRGIPVLLMHGLSGNSATWIANLNESIGFILADEGFDIWLGNIRGNDDSEHAIYTKDEYEFWDYSYEDMAEYDLPALIDYIRNVTNYKKILYVGFSQGSTLGFILFSQPEYNDKVAGFVALAPALTYRYCTDFGLNNIINHIDKFEPFLRMIGISRIKVWPDWFKKCVPIFCIYTPACELWNLIFTGYSNYFHNMTRMPIYTLHATGGTTLKNLMHMKQSRSGPYLAKFDYGKNENINRYGSVAPPEYNTTNIIIPISLFSSANDILSTSFLMEMTKQKLMSVIANEIISEPMFNHINFHMSSSMRSLLTDKLLFNLRYMWDQNGLK